VDDEDLLELVEMEVRVGSIANQRESIPPSITEQNESMKKTHTYKTVS
jgi:hypothetical protein